MPPLGGLIVAAHALFFCGLVKLDSSTLHKEVIVIKVIYFDYGGSHSSVVAANIHAGKLGSTETPPIKDIINLPDFDQTTPDDFGKIKHAGTDTESNDIYVLGTKSGNSGGLLSSLVEAQNVGNDFRFVDTMPYVNTWLRIGGWLSRGLSLPSLGRPFIRIGIKEAYPKLKTMVRDVGKTRLMEVLQ